MTARSMHRPQLAIALVLSIAAAVSGCGKKEPAVDSSVAPPPSAAAPPPAAEPAANPAAVPPPQPVQASDVAQQTWTPEAMEELLAPVALYPDPVLSQLLIASTNPQEVLDAGNWLIANESLKGKALDEAAAQAGFTPPVRALIQFPQTVDMMCMELGWTTELGQAFVADQAGVLDAVQRLRKQAQDVGNLQSSAAMKVSTQEQEGKQVIVLEPPKPEVVYVPQYDPVQAYAPLPQQTAATTTTPAATTTTTTETKSGYSGTQMFMTGALAFGAGILVNEIFDDDDHHHNNKYDYYYPNYGYGGMPYYPPYPYRPTYGNGYYPSNGYNRPPNYNNGFQNNGNIIINTNGRPGGGGNGYWDRYDSNNRPGVTSTNYRQPRGKSPITQAKPNRPELTDLNNRKPRPMPADYKRPSANADAANWKNQTQYKGRDQRPAGAKDTRDPATRIAEAQPGYSRPATKGGSRDASRPAPKVQGSYAGMERPRPDASDYKGKSKQPGTRDMQGPGKQPATRDMPSPRPETRDVKGPNKPATRDVKPPPTGGDRGYGTRDMPQASPGKAAKPAPMPQGMNRPAPKPTVSSGANRGSADRAASQRGKQSLPQGARSKGAGGGGGGGGKKKQGR